MKLCAGRGSEPVAWKPSGLPVSTFLSRVAAENEVLAADVADWSAGSRDLLPGLAAAANGHAPPLPADSAAAAVLLQSDRKGSE